VLIYVDMASAQYLKGTVIDYVKSLNGAGFKFNNPNAVRTCGCGHSFSG
jgi:iron-sulfur cluster assembly accessory protein